MAVMSSAAELLDSSGVEIERLYALQQANRAAVGASTAAQRIEKVRRLERAILSHRDEIRTAMWEDYRKPAAEVDLSEIYPIVSEARYAARHLRSWMKPKRVSSRLALFGSQSSILYESKGVVLIISPWNFPFNLTLGPLVSAVAAGNCAILKPSEMTPASGACMKRILAEVFDENEVGLVEGGIPVTESLLQRRFDHIFFTGSTEVGKIVMKAASQFLTPVTLELGGKSPVLVDKTANLADAARKVAWAKFFNCGQVCIAPDYVLVDETVKREFLELLRSSVAALGEDSRGILVNERHAARVRRLVDSALAGGAEVFLGGGGRGRHLEPTILTNVREDAPLMQEEIFGPVLPVVGYSSLEEVFAFMKAREKPLVLYVFSRARSTVREVLRRTRAGGTVVNHAMIHFYELGLPFGGAGQSGFGRSHGFHGFESFSNSRGILKQRLPFSAIELLFPPYTGKLKKKLIDFTVRWL